MDIVRLDPEPGSHCEPGVVHSGKFGCVSTRESSHGTSVPDLDINCNARSCTGTEGVYYDLLALGAHAVPP
jgi:hypothetical protein